VQGSDDLRRPSAVTCNERGDIYVKDDNAVHQYDRNGLFIRKIGNGFLCSPYGSLPTVFLTQIN